LTTRVFISKLLRRKRSVRGVTLAKGYILKTTPCGYGFSIHVIKVRKFGSKIKPKYSPKPLYSYAMQYKMFGYKSLTEWRQASSFEYNEN
jgi:hypothetical protein